MRFSEIDLNVNGELDCSEIRTWKEASLKSGGSVSCDELLNSVFNGSNNTVQRIDDGDGDRKVDLKELDESVKDMDQESASKLLEFIQSLNLLPQEVNRAAAGKPKISAPPETKPEITETPKIVKTTGITKAPNKTPEVTKP